MSSDPKRNERQQEQQVSWQERLIESLAADRLGFGEEDKNGFREIPTQKGKPDDQA